uniref:Uncharacterized protein n=1 Tax=Anopheles coluzzii TaxID=1518534 RepID=A0A8W7PJN4_ANOCL
MCFHSHSLRYIFCWLLAETEMELQKKTKSAHRVNSVEDTSGNDEINSTPNIDQSDESNKIHKNGRLYKGLQAGEHDLISSSTSDASVRVGRVNLWPLVVGALALALTHGNTPRVRC